MFEWKTPEVEETNRGKKAAGLGAAVVRIRRGMRRSDSLTAALMRPRKSACKQGEVRQAPEAGELLQAEAQVPGGSRPSVCAYCPRIPHVFEEQKNEAGEQLGHSFPRAVVLELGGDHGQPPSGG